MSECVPCNKKWQRAISGAVGLGKIITRTDPAAADTIERRLAVCGTCPALNQLIPRGAGMVGIGDTCTDCGCVLLAKARIQGETCPKGKWHD
ncbi:hypothetical protein [Conchiformibius steedae]|uniref:hypothetical protein n=1 Tax=Conchiformibius steedae TaxID=153493 RepID=UPI0026EA12E8|nr:hypothetical protein [Conchiformibius steedae]